MKILRMKELFNREAFLEERGSFFGPEEDREWVSQERGSRSNTGLLTGITIDLDIVLRSNADSLLSLSILFPLNIWCERGVRGPLLPWKLWPHLSFALLLPSQLWPTSWGGGGHYRKCCRCLLTNFIHSMLSSSLSNICGDGVSSFPL